MASEKTVERTMTGHDYGTLSKNRVRCGCVADLVNLAEMQICGPDHIGTSAFAEGLARSGNRSASRLDEVRPLDSTKPHAARVEPIPCVYHSFSGSNHPVPHPADVVLVAGTHQDAVDHCLIAQRIASDFRIPVLCLADSALQECLGCVELPFYSTFEKRSLAAPLPTPVTAGSLISCFESASDSLDRLHRPVINFGSQGAPQVLISCGREAALSRILLEHGCLSADALLEVQLLRPLPEEELIGHLRESELLILLAQPDNPLGAELLAALEVLAAKQPKFPKLLFAPLSGRPLVPQDLLSALPASMVASSSEHGRPIFSEIGLQLRMGATPGGSWSRELLVESASTIMRAFSPAMQLDSIQIRQDENEECSVLARLEIGVTDQETNSLDLLFFTENNLVDANPALARLKQSGILVLHCESRDIVQVWNGFSAESKRLILDKQFEVWWIRPWDLLDASGDVADQSCQVLNGAMLKSLAAKLKLDSSQLKAAPLSILERAGLQTVRKFEPSDHVIDKFSLEKNVSSAMQTADPEPSELRATKNNGGKHSHLSSHGGWRE